MKLNRDTEYALICLTAMAEDNRVFSARFLSDHYNVPYDLLCKILQRLSNAGILNSIRGSHGGYKLVGRATDIPLSAIVSALSEKQSSVPCLDERSCVRIDSCSIRGGVLQIQSMWDEMMSDMTIADFINANKSVGKGA